MMEFSYLSAFVVGLLGGVHCAGMCGGIVAALTLGLPEKKRQGRQFLPYLLAYNLARLCSYTLAGCLMGGIGWMATHWLDLRYVQLVLQVIAALFMILLGLYLAGWWTILSRLESAGAGIWKKIQPVSRRFMPVQTLTQAFIIGLLWGWLPCGLVYSVLVWSIATADPVSGGLLMLAFGLGTLPTLLALGVIAAALSRWVQNRNTRRVAGALVIIFGVVQLLRSITQ
jgi:sulfite exporter TauE/SafE